MRGVEAFVRRAISRNPLPDKLTGLTVGRDDKPGNRCLAVGSSSGTSDRRAAQVGWGGLAPRCRRPRGRNTLFLQMIGRTARSRQVSTSLVLVVSSQVVGRP